MDVTENSTASFNRSTTYNWKAEWIAIKSSYAMFLLFNVYLTASQIYYCVQETKRDERLRKLKAMLVTNGTRLKMIINICISACCAFTCVRTALPLHLSLGNLKDHNCDIYTKSNYILFDIAMYLIYVILWFRQLSFFTNPSLKELSSKCIRTASWMVIICLHVSLLVSILLLVVPHVYKATPFGCALHPKMPKYQYALLLVTTVLYQGSLLFLFIYPLLRFSRKTTPNGDTDNSLRPLVKRVTFIAVACIVTDALCGLFAYFGTRPEVELFYFVYYINLLGNNIFIICSFRDWRTRFFPFNGIWSVTKVTPVMNGEISVIYKRGLEMRELSESITMHANYIHL